MKILGFDIGGTKCAVIAANWDGRDIEILHKEKIKTDIEAGPYEMTRRLIELADSFEDFKAESVGISCGGPLNSETGVIMSPPNLPGWDEFPIVDIMKEHFGVNVHLQNDANACALAEWRFGAGRGTKNMVFMTFGTGLGAGLILDGRLYSGTTGNAGEVGHVRLETTGPVGYGKAGSFEGFCSGGGIAQIGYTKALEKVQQGAQRPAYYKDGMSLSDISAKSIADAADAGDPVALEVYRTSGEYLGKGLSILIDILDPELVVIGSIFARSRELLWDAAKKVIEREALPCAAESCKVVPASLGEHIGDYAAVAVALL